MFVGIDAGSSYIKIAVIEKSSSIQLKKIPTIPGYTEAIEEALPPNPRGILVTGYCRKTLSQRLNCPSISEIKAHATGVKRLIPDAKTVIDVGGQDSKIIKLSETGFSDFVMNDRCAAGTGRFLEMVAARLNTSVSELSLLAEGKKKDIKISSMCAVFAESEVVSLLAQEERREDIAFAAFDSITERIASFARGFGITPPVAVTGGLALSPVFVRLLQEKVSTPLIVPPEPQFTGAIGCAFIALSFQS
ncbi:MAG: hydrogenase [Deferribacteres bacterium]|nr:hydrogenase [Deferribacteres bacterium]